MGSPWLLRANSQPRGTRDNKSDDQRGDRHDCSQPYCGSASRNQQDRRKARFQSFHLKHSFRC